jgi:hypothetical protein
LGAGTPVPVVVVAVEPEEVLVDAGLGRGQRLLARHIAPGLLRVAIDRGECGDGDEGKDDHRAQDGHEREAGLTVAALA